MEVYASGPSNKKKPASTTLTTVDEDYLSENSGKTSQLTISSIDLDCLDGLVKSAERSAPVAGHSRFQARATGGGALEATDYPDRPKTKNRAAFTVGSDPVRLLVNAGYYIRLKIDEESLGALKSNDFVVMFIMTAVLLPVKGATEVLHEVGEGNRTDGGS